MDKTAKTEHPVQELIAKRWSPRAMRERPVPRETLLSLLEAARWAPSCFNAQPWSFLIATRDEPEELERMAGCLVESNRAWARRAPVLMLTVARLTFEHNDKPNRHAWHDIGLAVGNLSLEATARGLYLHQMAGIDRDKARDTYRIPEGYEAVTGIAIGYRADPEILPDALKERELKPRSRKPVAEFTYSGTWGQSWANGGG